MVAKKVSIQTIGRSDTQAPVSLVLKKYADGWSYEVQDLPSGPLPMPWRAETRQAAEKRLRESYDETVWAICVVEEAEPF
ncbi:hypothetical protein DSCO28_05870 [Desulfosarcina ovata subsp. sediminis]|uniref:Uncharacterized protein n=1 Tax=Desulfosarcina ovata subsp. sediminis TaxID=885957 RepID=A0A5K7ZGI4_9BACT|nr:hypothetical protein [Desulfosarcina ovata]BBO80021.1 hypothetical protein DSCO28_05870 [Desulfosarcina ovata subsp. sediminis]